MAIDRAARARRRWASRNTYGTVPATENAQSSVLAATTTGVDGLFNPGRKHQLEHLEWVAVAREDERESGTGPLDLDTGVVRMRSR